MANGGARPGSGRKKGSKNPETLLKERVLAELRQRIMSSADLIFDSQLSIARGIQFLYKIEKEWVKTGKNAGYWRPKKPVLVEDQSEIRAYIEERVERGDLSDDQNSGATYYFITTKEPNNSAIDSMFNRAFGKPKESTEVTLITPTPILAHVVHSDDRNPEGSQTQ